MLSVRLPRLAAPLFAALWLASLAAAATTPLRIHRSDEPRFPDALLMNEAVRSGDATLLISVDSAGQLVDALVVRDTHEAFGAEALATVRAWHFDPARVDGRPVPTRTEVKVHFSAPLAVVDMSASSTVRSLTAFAGPLESTYERICRPADLDHPPQAIRTPAPRPTAAASAAPAHPATRAVVDFIIDQTGHPRMPVLVEATDRAEGMRAAEALLQWQFAPPTQHGRPIAVRVRQEFVFPGKS